MNTELMAIWTLVGLLAAIVLGAILRRFIPDSQLSGETKDTVRVTIGFLATMTALVLGLLLNSAKNSYETVRSEVIQMSAKIAFLDRVLQAYGPGAAEARRHFHAAVEGAIHSMWPSGPNTLAKSNPDTLAGDAVYLAIQQLNPTDDLHRDMKNQATHVAIELAQLRTLLVAQLVSSISKPMLMILIYWLGIIFLGFSLLAPPNSTATVSLLIAAFSVSGAVFMILELDRPFGGLVRISNQPMLNALAQLEK